MKAQKTKLSFRHLLRECVKTSHSRIVTGGLLVGLIYAPFWLRDIVLGTLVGAGSLLLFAAIALGLHMLWKKRQQLATVQVSAEDRLLGHSLIISGIGLFPFCAATEWSQKFNFLIVLIGIACSSWGIQCFRRYPIPMFLIAGGLFPNSYEVGKSVWEAFTPPQTLERLMAWAGTIGLQAIGQPAQVQNTNIILPAGAVDVQWACNGFNMAATMAVASLIMALFFKQSFFKVTLLVLIGIILALLANIPRIMLMALANAYWGNDVFGFWHGTWGGQIFSTIMMTIYYYVAMAIVEQPSPKLLNKKRN